MKGAVYVNGTITPAEQAVIPVYDHGFLYGEGVYETLRTYNRVPFLYDRHMRRLRASAAALHLDVPFDDGTLRGVDRRHDGRGQPAPDALDSGSREAYIRILLTRGVGELTYDLSATPAPSLVIIVKPLDEPPARVFDEGITHLAGADPAQPSRIGEPDHQVEQPAQQRHRDAGGASQGRRGSADVQLPRRAVGVLAVELLPGARRRRADAEVGVRPARGNHAGVPVRGRPRGRRGGARKRRCARQDLATAEEAFITSTTRELSPVVRIDDRVIGTGRPGR